MKRIMVAALLVLLSFPVLADSLELFLVAPDSINVIEIGFRVKIDGFVAETPVAVILSIDGKPQTAIFNKASGSFYLSGGGPDVFIVTAVLLVLNRPPVYSARLRFTKRKDGEPNNPEIGKGHFV